MTPAPEKAAPIPAVTDGLREAAEQLKARAASFRRLSGNMLMYGEGQAQADERYADTFLSTARIVDRLLADRDARPSLPDSREAQIREDERDRIYERALRHAAGRMPDAARAAAWLGREEDVALPADRARARQGGNNG